MEDILKVITDPEAEKLLQDLVDKNPDVQSKFRKDISGFYTHKNCHEHFKRRMRGND